MSLLYRVGLPAVCVAALGACAPPEPEVVVDPVRAHCEAAGGIYELRSGKAGTVAVCVLPDGRTVDAVAYYDASLG